MAYLLVMSGKSAGTSFDLSKCPLSVGRDEKQDIRLLDKRVSTKHLVFDRSPDGGYSVKAEPKAKNGMLVNDQTVLEAVLGNGDRIRVGETEILFLDTDQASQVEAIKRVRVWPIQTTSPTRRVKRRVQA